jgi:hypothetical protein
MSSWSHHELRPTLQGCHGRHSTLGLRAQRDPCFSCHADAFIHLLLFSTGDSRIDRYTMVPLLYIAALFVSVHSHAIWSSPAPRYAGTDKLMAWPCGVGQTNNWNPETPVTKIHPGKQRLVFTETIDHPGAPFRIALSYETDDHYSNFVLLDHIPHNDATTVELKLSLFLFD